MTKKELFTTLFCILSMPVLVDTASMKVKQKANLGSQLYATVFYKL